MGDLTHECGRWTVLGAGTAVAHPTRSASGHLLETEDSKILIDAGSGTLAKLARQNVALADLDAVFISHAHLDHTLDLQALLFAAAIGSHGRSRDLPIFAAPEVRLLFERLELVFGKWVRPKGFDVVWHDVGAGEVSVGATVVHGEPLVHHSSSLGWRFELPGGASVAYSGDSELCEALVALCQGVDLAVLECSTTAARRVSGHLCPPDVAQVARDANATGVALVHRYAELDGVDLAAELAAHGYGGPVAVPEDGASLLVRCAGEP